MTRRANSRTLGSLGGCAMLGVVGWAGCTGLLDGEPGALSEPGANTQASSTCNLTASPIVRLSPKEYQNSVAVLFPGVSLPTGAPLPDERVDGFLGNADGQSISTLGVTTYEALARTIGEAASADLGAWAPCQADSIECIQQIGTELATAAYRRPLDDEELSAYGDFAASVYTQFGMTEGTALLVQGVLESPHFLFRPQFAPGEIVEEGVATGGIPLDGYEMATRLSYFFLDSMPDQDLLDAAESGELLTDEGIELQARRLLEDPAARPVITGFFLEWLKLYKLDEVALDPETFPEFDDALRADLQSSARMYLDKALWEDDSWESLMSGSHGFVNDRLAPLFGVANPGTDELVLVALDDSERRGILTQPPLLASTSHGISHSPIFRGVTMLESVLCTHFATPPAGALEKDPAAAEDVCTTRDRVAKTHTLGDCQGCHQSIDGAGFTFENYDALGRFRTEENGCAVDASGNFPGTLGEVTDAMDMADKLAQSEVPAQCMASNLLRYGLARSESGGDQCEVEAIASTISEGGSMQEAIVRMVLSPIFRHRLAPEQ